MKTKLSRGLQKLLKVALSTHKKDLPFIIDVNSGKKIKTKFDFKKCNAGKFIGENHCGSIGCKMHIFPALFPKDFSYDADPSIKQVNGLEFYRIFKIENREFIILFYPKKMFFDIVSIEVNSVTISALPANATEAQVNNNILKFISAKSGLSRKELKEYFKK